MANERARGLGYDFVTDDRYLVDPFSPTDGISYEGDGSPVSYANSMGGIMTQAPIPGPLKYIPPNDGGGKDDDDDDDVNTTNSGITNKMDIAKNALALYTNPIAFGLTKLYQGYRNNKKAKADFAADQAYKAQQERDFKEMAANPKNPDGSTAAYNYAGRDNDQGTHTSTISNEQAQTNQESYRGKDGGRAGYFFGGRARLQGGGRVSFKNGGLASIL